MARFNFRIGTKLGITAGIGVVLVGGMLINQLLGNWSISELSTMVIVNTANAANAKAAETAMLRAQFAAREIGLALSPDALEATLRSLNESTAEAGEQAAAAGQRARRPQVKELYRDLKASIEGYAAMASELAAAQRAAIAGAVAGREANDVWMRAFEALQDSPRLAAVANRYAIEARLRESSTSLNAARAAAWRYAVTFKSDSRELVTSKATAAIDALKRARLLVSDPDLAAEIDGLVSATDRFKLAADQAVTAEALKDRILNERVRPAAADIAVRIAKGVSVGNEMTAFRQGELLAELNRGATVALVVGLMVIAMLISSSVFSALTIARPIRRIGNVLLQLANGDKALEVPYSTRGDEVGDAARAAKTFQENLIRIEQMEAEQQNIKAAAVLAGKAAMAKLADEFQAAIGGIVNTVSSASGQLEAAAGTLTATADSTQGLSGMVAAAAEQASANVGAVASAAEEMSASVTEISRQVHELKPHCGRSGKAGRTN